MFCQKCGAENNDNAKFCSNCSNPFNGAVSPTPTPAPSPAPVAQKKLKTWQIVLLTLVGLVVLFVIYALLSPDDPKKSADAGSASPSVVASDKAAEASATVEATESAAAETPVATEKPKATAKPKASKAPEALSMQDALTKDIFDWQAMSDKEKQQLVFSIQMIWHTNGVTGEAVDMDSTALVKKISNNLEDQAVIFDLACKLFNIDPIPYNQQVEK